MVILGVNMSFSGTSSQNIFIGDTTISTRLMPQTIVENHSGISKFNGGIPEHEQEVATGSSAIIIAIFLLVFLCLVCGGVACSYWCFKFDTKQTKDLEKRRKIWTNVRHITYRTLTSQSENRSIPNWYSPNPNEQPEKTSHLIVSVVPIQVDAV